MPINSKSTKLILHRVGNIFSPLIQSSLAFLMLPGSVQLSYEHSQKVPRNIFLVLTLICFVQALILRDG